MMIIIEEKEALEKLTMPVCIDLMEKALSDLFLLFLFIRRVQISLKYLVQPLHT